MNKVQYTKQSSLNITIGIVHKGMFQSITPDDEGRQFFLFLKLCFSKELLCIPAFMKNACE